MEPATKTSIDAVSDVPSGVPTTQAQQSGREVLPKASPLDSHPKTPKTPKTDSSIQTAIEAILEPLKRGEGFRHGWLGDTRMGKTYANRMLIEHALKRGVALSFVLDDKGPQCQYRGSTRANMDDLKARPLNRSEDPCRIVFRGHVLRTGKVCSTDDIARVVLDDLRADRVLVSIDELRRAATPAGREWRGPWVPRLFSEGGGLGMSIAWTTQSPQRIPLEAFDQSETLGIFRARGRAVHYLEEQLFLDSDMVKTLPSLKVGEWVLYRKSEPWDGNVYRFSQ